MDRPTSTGCCGTRQLRVATLVLSFIGLFLIWGPAIGFSCGYAFRSYIPSYSQPTETITAGQILVAVNVAYIYHASVIIFSLLSPNWSSRSELLLVRGATARLMAFMFVGIAVFIASTVWFAGTREWAASWDTTTTLFSCSFSFVWTLVVVCVAGAYVHQSERQSKRVISPEDP